MGFAEKVGGLFSGSKMPESQRSGRPNTEGVASVTEDVQAGNTNPDDVAKAKARSEVEYARQAGEDEYKRMEETGEVGVNVSVPEEPVEEEGQEAA